jgi:hypothetical protein
MAYIFSDQPQENNPPTPVQTNGPIPPSNTQESVFINATNPQEQKSGKWIIGIIVGVIIIIVGSTIAFAYIKKIGPFAVSSYTENNFFSSLLEKSSKIDSLSYMISSSFSVVQRENDAKPFVVQVSNTPELRQQYQDDAERAKDASVIISMLRNYSNNTYPLSLKKLVADSSKKNSYYKSTSINDPVSGKEYEYTATENGKNFALKVNFEIKDSINSIMKSYGYTATSTLISGTEITFTKNSPYYFYLPSEPPKPFLVSLQENIRQIPPDVSASLAISASSDLKSDTNGWSFNIDAEGNFSDLTYKINADAIKKNTDYYFRINNMPVIFFFNDLASLKGKWVKIPTNIASSSPTGQSSYSELGYISKQLPEYEKSYKENRQNFTDLLKQVISVADSEKLVKFKNSPRGEKVDGRELTRYELSIRKEAILPFYTKVTDLVNNNDKFKDFKLFADQGMVEYLQSKEFDDVFDYYDKNVKFVFWADSNGFPAILEVTTRIVPPDTATQLADKQMNLVFKMVTKDINKPIDIKAPEGATAVDQIIKNIEKNTFGYDLNGQAEIKADLAGLRAQVEVVYDKNNNSYGQQPFALGPCKQTASTLFGDKDVFTYINKATGDDPSKATCVSKSVSGKVDTYAVSAPLSNSAEYSWCVDSHGNSKQIKGAIKKDSCN